MTLIPSWLKQILRDVAAVLVKRAEVLLTKRQELDKDENGA